MCGRYQAWIEDDELLKIIEREKKGNASRYFLNDEVRPGDEIPIIYGSYAAVRAYKAIWGFPKQAIPKKEINGNELIINARAETVMQKPMFRYLVENSRAIVLMSGYYEWRDGRKYLRKGGNGTILAVALERNFDDERRYVILTSGASGDDSDASERMPLIIPRENMQDWLYDVGYAKRVLEMCKAG